jgi:membrane associated rhomboid family serine protease
MSEHFIGVVLVGCLVVGALALAIYGQDRTGQASRANLSLGAAGLVGVWLVRRPREPELVVEAVVRGILAFATRFL